MPVALLQARYTPTSGGSSDDKFLACNAGGYLYVLTDAAAVGGGATATGATRIAGSDGTYDRVVKTGAAGDIYVSFQSARPGEDAVNDWVETCIQSHATTSVTHNEASFTAAPIFDSTDVSALAAWSIYVRNTGSYALTDVIVEVSDNGALWKELTAKDADELACETLGAGLAGVAYICTGACQKYVQVRATAGTATTTTSVLYGRY